MKILLAIIIVFQISLTTNSQSRQILPDSIRLYLDTVIFLNKTYSIYSTDNNWDSIKTLAYQIAVTAKSVKDLFPAIQFIYNAIGDNHGYFEYGGERVGILYKKREISPYLINEIFGNHIGFQTKLLQKKYGYILIPTINTEGSNGENEWAKKIRDSICSISLGVRGWIIDLRFNQGGNLFSMLGGLADIIGDGLVGRLTNTVGATTNKWNIKNGSVYVNDSLAANAGVSCALNQKLPIVVLISEMTASSGEGIAIVLKGRPNTLILGKQTWGVSTGLKGYKIDENSFVMVTKSYMTDRKGNIYKNGILPDKEIIGGDNVEDLNSDSKIIEAIRWLNEFNK